MNALRSVLANDAGAALSEYAVVAAAIALPLLAVGYAVATSGGIALHATTANLQNWGETTP